MNREAAIKEFPGYVNNLGISGTKRQARTSWIVFAFPYIEQQALWDAWSDGEVAFDSGGKLDSNHETAIELLICPSDPPARVGEANLSYVVNAGYIERTTLTMCREDNWIDTESPNQDTGEYKGNGFFSNFNWHIDGDEDQAGPAKTIRSCCLQNGRTYHQVGKMTMAYLQSKGDGATETLMLSENLRAVHWAFAEASEYMDDGLTPSEKYTLAFAGSNRTE